MKYKFTLGFEKEEIDRLRKVCKKTGNSMSSVIREGLAMVLKEKEAHL